MFLATMFIPDIQKLIFKRKLQSSLEVLLKSIPAKHCVKEKKRKTSYYIHLKMLKDGFAFIFNIKLVHLNTANRKDNP